MNLSHLYYFQKLAALESYAQASRELHITQPSLSNAMRSLERELGVVLFERVGRTSRLTDQGAEFLGYVNDSLGALEAGIEAMERHSGHAADGQINLGCIITVQTDYVPRTLLAYRMASACNVAVNVTESTTPELLAQLAQGKVDVVLAGRDGRETSGRFEYIPVVAQRIVAGMSAEHPLADRPWLTAADLTGCDILTYSHDIPLGRAVERVTRDMEPGRVSYSYRDESILAGLAASGSEVALMAETFFAHALDDIALVPLVSDEESRRGLYHRIYLVHDTQHAHSFRVNHFINYMREVKTLKDPEPDPLYLD